MQALASQCILGIFSWSVVYISGLESTIPILPSQQLFSNRNKVSFSVAGNLACPPRGAVAHDGIGVPKTLQSTGFQETGQMVSVGAVAGFPTDIAMWPVFVDNYCQRLGHGETISNHCIFFYPPSPVLCAFFITIK